MTFKYVLYTLYLKTFLQYADGRGKVYVMFSFNRL